jgi:prevent-host-death family protein
MRYTTSQARTHFSRLIREAEEGEEVIIMRGSTDIARVLPLTPSEIERYSPGKTSENVESAGE